MSSSDADFPSFDDETLTAAIPLSYDHSRLWEEMSESLSRHGKDDLAALRKELEREGIRETGWSRAIRQHLDRVDEEVILSNAARLGREWLATEERTEE